MVSGTRAIYSKNPSPGSPRAGASSWSASVGALTSGHLPLVNSTPAFERLAHDAELRCWRGVGKPGKRPITGGFSCVSYSLAQLSSQLRLDLQAAFTTSKPPTLNRSRARRSN